MEGWYFPIEVKIFNLIALIYQNPILRLPFCFLQKVKTWFHLNFLSFDSTQSQIQSHFLHPSGNHGYIFLAQEYSTVKFSRTCIIGMNAHSVNLIFDCHHNWWTTLSFVCISFMQNDIIFDLNYGASITVLLDYWLSCINFWYFISGIAWNSTLFIY